MDANFFSERLRRRRMELGLSGKELAARVHISRPYMSQLEKGLREPSPELLNRLADELDISVDMLWMGRSAMNVRETSETGYAENIGKTQFVCHSCAAKEVKIQSMQGEINFLKKQLDIAGALIDHLIPNKQPPKKES